MDYIYKVTKKLKEDKLFNKIFPIEDSESYTKTVTFNKDSKIVNSLIGYLNNKKWQENAGVFDPEQRKILEEQGLKFEDITTEEGETKFEIVVTDDLLNEFTAGYLMFDKEGDYKDTLYIGSATDTYPFVFFNTKVVDEHIGDVIKALKDEKYIKKVNLDKKGKN